MSWSAIVPHEMAVNKPPHGHPCNRCGTCCAVSLCPLGTHVFGRRQGPCPALVKDVDADGKQWTCGLVMEPMRYATRRALLHGWEKMREAAALLVGTGQGCDCRINGETPNETFYQKLRIFDRQNKDGVAKARKLWGI